MPSTARAHFAGPVVKHNEDEERSLFPRLRALGRLHAPHDLSALLDQLETQHRLAEQVHRDFDATAASLPHDGSPDATDGVERFCQLAAVLVDLYRAHMRIENEGVFPLAARLLPAKELRTIQQEMRARRQIILKRT